MKIYNTNPSKTFEQFVKEQSPSAPINHKGGWYTCAVGDYMDVVLQNRELANPSNQEFISSVIDDEVLEACLANNGYKVEFDFFYSEYTSGVEELVITTYGDIQTYYAGDLEIEIKD